MQHQLFASDATTTVRERAGVCFGTLLLHGLLVWCLFQASGIGFQGIGDSVHGEGDALMVEFIALPSPTAVTPARSTATPEHAVLPEQHDPTAHQDTASPGERDTIAHVLSEAGEYVPLDANTPAAQPPSQLATTNRTPNGGTADDLLASYRAALRARIIQTWRTVTDRRFPQGCVLHLSQGPGGVVTATSANGCTLSSEDRLQLEAAALIAQPLPYVGYEAVFAPEMELRL